MTKIHVLHKAMIKHKDMTVVWLDLANAYGSIPPPINTSDFNNIYIKFSSNRFTTTIF